MQIFILNICLASFRKEDILFNSIENMKMKTSIGLFYYVWRFYFEGVWLWRIKWGLLTGDNGVDRGNFTWRVVNMDLKCWRTDKQTVNIDGLFYITLTVVVIPLHQLSLLSLPHHYLCKFQSWLGKFWVDWWGFS